MDDKSNNFDSTQLELFNEIAPLPSFLSKIPANTFAFLNSERRVVYSIILNFLFLRRQSHEIEKYHNDIFDALQVRIENITITDYTMTLFRSDIEPPQLFNENQLIIRHVCRNCSQFIRIFFSHILPCSFLLFEHTGG